MNDAEHPLNALPQGHRLQEYELVKVLGFGGFGMTYLGYDHNLDKAVAIKEYLPNDIAARTGDNTVAPKASQFRGDFEWGLERFLDEARTLARFDHRHIIKVHRFFEAHGTAYIVMEYAEGETLSAYLDRKWTLKEEELQAILNPILDGLEVVHGADFLHRDIKPGNIIIRDEDNSPVLLDFGAARQAIGARSKSVTSIITPGYAPIEQYSTQGDQGPWTDLYALGALCYRALTGEAPADATERVIGDAVIPVSERCAGRAGADLLAAIDWAIKVDKGERPQSVAAWRTALEGGPRDGAKEPRPVVKPAKGRPPKSRQREPVDEPRERQPRKRKGVVFAALVCVLALLMGGGYYYYENVHLPEQRRQAQEAERTAKISSLLSGASEDLAQDRLTSPAGNNAWEKYQALLEVSPDHKEASAGLDSVIGRYATKFDASLHVKEFDKAEEYVSRIRGVWADAPVLAGLVSRLSSARGAELRRRQAEQDARLAVQEAKRRREAQIASYARHFEKAIGERELDQAGRYLDSLQSIGASVRVLGKKEGRLTSALEAERLRQEQRRVGRKFSDCAGCPQMVVVPSGSFTMGSPSGAEGRGDDEGPRHVVRIDYRLAVGVYEVTFAEWDACANAGGCGGYIPEDKGWGRGNRPVMNVSWNDAQLYLRWLSQRTGQRYRLLSESEWEYVARAGTTTPFHFGSTISTDQANYDGNYTYGGGRKGVYREKTISVGSFRANAWGLYDVHGNVWEWVGDCWNDSYTGAPADGSAWARGDCAKRVLRGGSWISEPRNLRSASRSWNSTGRRFIDNGFRVARTFTP